MKQLQTRLRKLANELDQQIKLHACSCKRQPIVLLSMRADDLKLLEPGCGCGIITQVIAVAPPVYQPGIVSGEMAEVI